MATDREPCGEESLLDVERIAARREELGLTQEQAAERAGFKGRQAWNNIEGGRQTAVSLATLCKLALALEVEARELLKPGPKSVPRRAPSSATNAPGAKGAETGGKGRAKQASRGRK